MLVAFLIGCGGRHPLSFATPAYGVVTPIVNPDPSLALVDLTYEPASPVTPGTRIVFKATANKSSQHVNDVILVVGGNDQRLTYAMKFQLQGTLRDNGISPDETAGDGIYIGELTLPMEIQPIDGLPVIAEALWVDSLADRPTISGQDLTVISDEQ